MIALKSVCIMHIEFYLHRSNLFVSKGIIHGGKKHSSGVIYGGILPIRIWSYLSFCQGIFFEFLIWLKTYTALSGFDGFCSASWKTVSLCVCICVWVCVLCKVQIVCF